MNLIKEKWNKNDFARFREFEKTLIEQDEKKRIWEKRIVNTKLECFGRTSQKVKKVAKEIKKGNFISLIENLKIQNFFESILVANLICEIKDFDTFKKELSKFAKEIDNWASCDTIFFENRDKIKLHAMAKCYLASEKPFVRRVGLRIYFELIKDRNYLKECFTVLNSLKVEKEYYVNMCAAWLLCECFIKHREETLKFFKNNKTNDFVINKAISKCRDSFRVSKDDKELLLKFRRRSDDEK